MEKIKRLQVPLDGEMWDIVEKRSREYGLDNVNFVRLLIRKGYVRDTENGENGEIVKPIVDKSKYATDSNVVGETPKKSLRNTFKIPQKSESPNNPKSSNFISFE